MFIDNVHFGTGVGDEPLRFDLYAELKNKNTSVVIKSSLSSILMQYFDRQDEVINYKEAFRFYVDNNTRILLQVSKIMNEAHITLNEGMPMDLITS